MKIFFCVTESRVVRLILVVINEVNMPVAKRAVIINVAVSVFFIKDVVVVGVLDADITVVVPVLPIPRYTISAIQMITNPKTVF